MRRYDLSMIVIFLTAAFIFLPRLAHAQTNDELIDTYPVWRQAVGGSVIAPPVAQVESVVVATDGGNLKSYSVQGTPLWDYYAGRITPFISRSREGTSYIARTDGTLIAVNRAGRELWRFDLASRLVSPVLIGWDSRIFAVSETHLTCLTAAGAVLWSHSLEAKTALAPILDVSGGVVLVLENGSVLRFDAFGSSVAYSARASGTGVATAAASVRLASHDAILLFYADRRVETIVVDPARAEGGAPTSTGNLTLPSPPLAAAGRGSEAAVLLQNGSIILLAPSTNEIRWTAQSHIGAREFQAAPSSLDVQLTFDERGIYALSKSGASSFTEDGTRLWLVQLRGAAAVPAIGEDGVLYSGGTNWILDAYHLEDRVKAQERVLYAALPEGDYGTAKPGPSPWTGFYLRFEASSLESRFQSIRRAVQTGTVGSREKEFLAVLMEIAGSFLPHPPWARSPSSSLPDPQYRIEAINLLARIGSWKTIPFLANLFSNDPEPLVQAAAAVAIGTIGVDPDGVALRAFRRAVSAPSALRDEIVLTSVAEATGALCRFSGPPLSDEGVRLLTTLTAPGSPSRARRQAEVELRNFLR